MTDRRRPESRPPADRPTTPRGSPPRRWLGLALAIAVAGPPGLAPAFGDDPAPPVLRPIRRVEDYAPPEEFVEAAGVKTHFVAIGDVAARPIVFIHGFGSSTFTWRKNLGPIAALGYRAIAIDVRGFGLTAKPRDGRYDLASFADHLAATLDALELDRPILVGNSMGGAIAARVALTRPDRVAGVVLVDAMPPRLDGGPMARPGVAGPPAATKGASVKLRAALARAMVTREIVASGLRRAYRDPANVTDEAIEAHIRPLFIEGGAEALIALVDRPAPIADNLPPLSGLKPPALIVWGRHDRVIPVAMAASFARDLPKARVTIFESSGHMPHEEEADAFNATLAEFAASTLAPTR